MRTKQKVQVAKNKHGENFLLHSPYPQQYIHTTHTLSPHGSLERSKVWLILFAPSFSLSLQGAFEREQRPPTKDGDRERERYRIGPPSCIWQAVGKNSSPCGGGERAKRLQSAFSALWGPFVTRRRRRLQLGSPRRNSFKIILEIVVVGSRNKWVQT